MEQGQYRYTLRNYRPFTQAHPIKMTVGEGITFILGPNNVGKSALLRSFVELKAAIGPAAASDQRKYDADLAASFETIVSRSNPSDAFTVEVADKTTKWNVSFTHKGNLHTTRVGVYMDVHGDNASKENRLKGMSPFLNALYVPSFRSPTVNAQGDILACRLGNNLLASGMHGQMDPKFLTPKRLAAW